MCRKTWLVLSGSHNLPWVWRLVDCLTDAAEVVPAGMSAKIMSAYIGHYESSSGSDAREGASLDRDFGRFLSTPSQEFMLFSCFVLGSSTAAFVYRRQLKDPHQVMFLTMAVVSALVLGKAVGASANMVLLGYIPWSVCIAMVVSTIFFEGVSWMRFGQPVALVEETTEGKF